MAKLTISFSRPHVFKIYAWLIMKVENTHFSHVAISWKSEYLDREIVYQASHTMVNFCEGKRYIRNHLITDTFEVDMDENIQKKVIQFAMDHAGIPYGFKQVLGIGYIKLMGLFGKKVNNPFNNGKNTYVCCELVADILKQYFNMDKTINIPLDNITPKQLYNLLKININK